MSKKTLKHSIDGEVFTRTTARDYTHVLVGRVNKAAVVADNDAYEARLPDLIAEACASHAKAIKVAKAIIKPENFGKFYRNHNGYKIQIDEREVEKAHSDLEWFAEEDRDLNQANIYAQSLADRRAKEAEINEDEWFVISWHSRPDLAEKAAAQSINSHFDTRVEAINGGEE